MFKTFKRLISLEDYLGVRFSDKDCDGGYSQHLNSDFGLIKRLIERVEKLEKFNEEKYGTKNTR